MQSIAQNLRMVASLLLKAEYSCVPPQFEDSPDAWVLTLAKLGYYEDPCDHIMVGAGEEGIVLSLNDGTIIKVLSKKDELKRGGTIKFSQALLNQKPKFFVRVFAVEEVTTSRDQVVVIHMERLEPASWSFTTRMATFAQYFFNDVMLNDTIASLQQTKKRASFEEADLRFLLWVKGAKGEAARLGLDICDVQPDNVMRRGPQHVLIDQCVVL